MDISGEFQNLVVTSGIVQKNILENASYFGEWTSSIQQLPYTQSSTQKGYCYKQEVAIVLIVLSHDRGNPLVLTSVLFLAHWLL